MNSQTTPTTDPAIARYERSILPTLQTIGALPCALPHRGINRSRSVTGAYESDKDWAEIPTAYIGTGSREVFLRGDIAAVITSYDNGCHGHREIVVRLRRLAPGDGAALLADGAAVRSAAESDDRMAELEHHDAIVSRLDRCALAAHDVLPYHAA